VSGSEIPPENCWLDPKPTLQNRDSSARQPRNIVFDLNFQNAWALHLIALFNEESLPVPGNPVSEQQASQRHRSGSSRSLFDNPQPRIEKSRVCN
jgi:hypothetical protein